jgi:tagatose 1,6-diphosphate aldolase
MLGFYAALQSSLGSDLSVMKQVSITYLLYKTLSDNRGNNMTGIGKFRHLSRCSTKEGHFVILAIDHRANLLEKLNQFSDTPLSDNDFSDFKQEIIAGLAPYSSAVLTDPVYGIAPAVVNQAISGKMGLLAPIEVTDYGVHPSLRAMQFIPNWSVEKIKRMGGDGVKLLLPYHPEAENVMEKHEVVKELVDDCTHFDIPFFLEPIPYSLDPKNKLSNSERLRICLEMCQTFSKMGVDILKLPFPVDHSQSQDRSEWQEACEQVTEACDVPWALLSEGVDYETFLQQVEIACKAGAAGVIVGRAVWAETVELKAEKRQAFIQNVGVERMKTLSKLCRDYAKPWYQQFSAPDTSLNWYELTV